MNDSLAVSAAGSGAPSARAIESTRDAAAASVASLRATTRTALPPRASTQAMPVPMVPAPATAAVAGIGFTAGI